MNKLQGNKCFFAIIVDLAKAYNMMNWKFINSVIMEVQIPDKHRQIIMDSISSMKMSAL